MRTAAFAAAALLFAGGLARADAVSSPTTDWAMEVVVVEAAQKGPPLWRLKKGDSEVWILGKVGQLPKGIAWNKAQLEQVVDGAKEVVLPPEASTGFFGMFEVGWFILTHRDALSMPHGKKLEPSLQPDIRDRFVKAHETIGTKADRYQDDSPLIAGFKLLGDYAKKTNMVDQIPEISVRKIADAKNVKVRRVANYDAKPLVKDMLRLPLEAGYSCLDNALTDYETMTLHAAPLAEAWAVGDIAGIKAHYASSMLESCVKQSRKYGELDRRAVDDMTGAVNEALSKPGKTVMVMDIGWLFRATGIADQLRKEGVVIEGPAE
jgi:uncharacterized protein YbaP (TraB family)